MNRAIKKITCVLLCVLSILGCCILPVSANDSESISTVIDDGRIAYTAATKSDTKKKGKKYEYKYLDMSVLFADFYDKELLNPNAPFILDTDDQTNWFFEAEGYIDNDNKLIVDDNNKKDAKRLDSNEDLLKPKQYKNGAPMAFPYYYSLELAAKEADYAVEINAKLTSSLNAILRLVNGKPFESVTEMVNKSILIRPDSANNVVFVPTNSQSGYMIVYADLTDIDTNQDYKEGYSEEVQSIIKNAGVITVEANDDTISNASSIIKEYFNSLFMSIDDGLYCYVIPYTSQNTQNTAYTIKFNKASVYEYAFPKGRTTITNGSNLTIAKKFGDEGQDEGQPNGVKDISWMTIHAIAFYANYTYKYENLSVNTLSSIEEEGAIVKYIQGLVAGALKAFRSFFGMKEVDELVYQTGSDQSGVMRSDWWDAVLKYSLLFQTIAWGILIFGLMKMAIDLNLSAINPMKRLDLYQTIEKFVLAGIGLVILIPAAQFLIECNDTIVEIFSTQVDAQHGLRMPKSGHWLLNIIIEFIWNGVVLYINFVYIMRSVTIAILIASGPFFISTGAISSNGRSPLFSNWSKELIANIFVQAIHSFILAFLIELMGYGSPLEEFAILTSFVPLTEMFRSMIFGTAGSAVLDMAKQGAQTVGSAMGGIAKGMVGGAKAIGGAANNAISGEDSSKEDESSGGGGGGGKRGNTHALASTLQKKIIQKGAATGHLGLGVAGAAATGVADFALSGAGHFMNSLGALTNMGVTGQTDHRIGEMVADAVEDNGIGGNAARAYSNVAQPAIEAKRAERNAQQKRGTESSSGSGANGSPDSAGTTAAKGLEEERRSQNIERIVRSNKTDSMLTHYAMAMGHENNPESFVGDNYGGGDLTFRDKASAAAFMRNIGQDYAANQITDPTTYGNYDPYGDGTVQGHIDPGTKKYIINYNTDSRNGRGTMGAHGLAISMANNSKDMYLATKGMAADDVFAYHKSGHNKPSPASLDKNEATVQEQAARQGSGEEERKPGPEL